MRFGPAAPPETMDFLFIELMGWGRDQGYRWLNLGMAPLSGLDRHPLAPAWHRVGNFIFRHGEHFYNFEGLRRYKAKFDPQWEPKYLVARGGIALPRVLDGCFGTDRRGRQGEAPPRYDITRNFGRAGGSRTGLSPMSYNRGGPAPCPSTSTQRAV